MLFGISFQLPAPPNMNPFLTPFQYNLDLNASPLTRFPLPRAHRDTHKRFTSLLASFRLLIKRYSLRIISTDKSSGLVILTDTELQVLYSTYLLQFKQIPAFWYYKFITSLRRKIFNLDHNLRTSVTDDRPPTAYFKLKTHKDTFPSSYTVFTNIFTFDPYAIAPFARPIVNHSSSISTLASKLLRPLITPIITNHPLLSSDVYTANGPVVNLWPSS